MHCCLDSTSHACLTLKAVMRALTYAGSSWRAMRTCEAATAGPSSMIFWWRRWTLQSRVNSDATLPCMSATSCTSK